MIGLQGELEAYGACDPVRVEEKRRAVILAREAALRHTGEDFSPLPPLLPFFLPCGVPYGKKLTRDRRQLPDFDDPLHPTA